MKAKEITAYLHTQTTIPDGVSSFKVGFLLCTEGEASLLVDHRICEMRRNTLLILFPNAHIHVLHHSDDWEGRIEADYVENYYPTLEAIDPRSRIVIRDLRCIDISEERADYLHRLCDLIGDPHALHAEDAAPHSVVGNLATHRHRFLRSALLTEVAATFLTHKPDAPPQQSKHENTVSNFLMLMLRDSHKERTVAYYAEQLHTSPYYLSTIIKEETGKTALQWINLFTINFSKHYLVDTDMSVKEIAATLNFPDPSTFGRYFKHYMGCTPGEYREANR